MTRRQVRSPRIAVYVVVGVLVLLVGVWLGGHPSWLPSPLRNALVDDSNAQLVNDALDIISHDYYRKVDRSDLLNKGLAGAVASLDDPYSHYLSPTDYHSFQNQSNPHVAGVGIDVMSGPSGLKVIDVFPGTPAAKAGLKAGDVIQAVGGTQLAGRSATAATGLITGHEGTQVKLTVARGSDTRVLTLRRANVLVTSGGIINDHGTKTGDVRLTSFTDGSGAAVRAQVEKVVHQGAKAMILDLRDNGGGLLDEAVNVASIFVADGTIVSTDGRSQPRQVYMAKGGAIAPTIPMVVLVDRGTASAAEIVTGPRWSARTRTARACSRRFSRCRTAARSTSPSASTSPRTAPTWVAVACARARGSSPTCTRLTTPTPRRTRASRSPSARSRLRSSDAPGACRRCGR
jgi:carboxyl-terminal processing protease